MPKRVVVTLAVWHQSSADGDSERFIHTCTFAPDTPLARVLEWADRRANGLAYGNITITPDENDV